MTFQQSVKTCLTQKYFFVFKGRASRSEFWWFMLFICLVNLASSLLLQGLPLTTQATISLVISLALLPANIGVTVRRLHDRNMAGWWILAPIATLVFWVLSGQWQNPETNTTGSVVCLGMCLCYLVVLCMPGQVGANRFGEQPV